MLERFISLYRLVIETLVASFFAHHLGQIHEIVFIYNLTHNDPLIKPGKDTGRTVDNKRSSKHEKGLSKLLEQRQRNVTVERQLNNGHRAITRAAGRQITI